MAELEALLASHPWAWAAGAAGGIALAFSIALWRTKLALGVEAEGRLGSGGRLEAWLRFGFVGLVLVRDADGRRHRAITLARRRWFDRALVRAKTKPGKKRRDAPRQGRKAGFNGVRFIRRHWRLLELARFAWRRRVDFHIHALAGRVEVGFEQPDHTGELYGAFCALTPVVPGLAARHDGAIQAGGLTLIPNWSLEDHLAGHLRIGVDIRLVRLAFMTACFLATHWRRGPRGRRRRRHRRIAAV